MILASALEALRHSRDSSSINGSLPRPRRALIIVNLPACSVALLPGLTDSKEPHGVYTGTRLYEYLSNVFGIFVELSETLMASVFKNKPSSESYRVKRPLTF